LANTLYYYTGTGNSLWIARRLADALGGADILAMRPGPGAEKPGDGRITALVFPVHMWGVPAAVLQFVDKWAPPKGAYVSALAVNAGQVANTLVQLQGVLAARGIALNSGFEFVLPSNYIPWGGPGPAAKREARYSAARGKIAAIARRIGDRETLPVEKGPLWQRLLFTRLYRLSFPHVPGMDKSFWVDEKCNACGICEKVCPAGNIRMGGEKPAWSGRCEQCLACIQWCPREAIQYGKKTPKYERYHHPDVALRDMLAQAGSPKTAAS
jgi:ferredoxin